MGSRGLTGFTGFPQALGRKMNRWCVGCGDVEGGLRGTNP